MGDEANGDQKGRLDRVEEFLPLLVNEHIQFHEEHRQLLKSQVLLNDTVQKLSETQAKTEKMMAEKMAELASAQAHTDERLNVLIGIVDGLVRRPPQ